MFRQWNPLSRGVGGHRARLHFNPTSCLSDYLAVHKWLSRTFHFSFEYLGLMVLVSAVCCLEVRSWQMFRFSIRLSRRLYFVHEWRFMYRAAFHTLLTRCFFCHVWSLEGEWRLSFALEWNACRKEIEQTWLESCSVWVEWTLMLFFCFSVINKHVQFVTQVYQKKLKCPFQMHCWTIIQLKKKKTGLLSFIVSLHLKWSLKFYPGFIF